MATSLLPLWYRADISALLSNATCCEIFGNKGEKYGKRQITQKTGDIKWLKYNTRTFQETVIYLEQFCLIGVKIVAKIDTPVTPAANFHIFLKILNLNTALCCDIGKYFA